MKYLNIVRTVALLAVVAFGAAACQTTDPIYQPINVPMAAPPKATMSQVAAAIKQAGAGLGWQMIDQAPGFIRGTYTNQRNQTAEVNVQHDTRTFSIYNAGSAGLKASGGEIHGGYNRWVKNLEQRILAQTAAIPAY